MVPIQVYDDFTSRVRSRDLWQFVEYPAGDGHAKWRCQEPRARTEVGDGTLDMQIHCFERANDRSQLLDDNKHHLVSVHDFPVPGDQLTTLSFEMAATNINASPYDHRDGLAIFRLMGVEPGWTFQIGTSSSRVMGIYGRTDLRFVRHRASADIVTPLLAELRASPGLSHLHEVTLSPLRGSVEWRVDGRLVYASSASMLPNQIKIGLGVSTLHPIADGRSQSIRGQGISASFGPVGIRSSEE
jgi:Family of unknown function (DUF6081)